MTNNAEKAAFVINETYADEYVKPHMTPLAVAQALADAGLLMPELPEPDCRHDDPEYREEYSDAWGTSNAPDAWEVREFPLFSLGVFPGHDEVTIWNEDGYPYATIDPASARCMAYSLLAAAECAERHQS